MTDDQSDRERYEHVLDVLAKLTSEVSDGRDPLSAFVDIQIAFMDYFEADARAVPALNLLLRGTVALLDLLNGGRPELLRPRSRGAATKPRPPFPATRIAVIAALNRLIEAKISVEEAVRFVEREMDKLGMRLHPDKPVTRNQLKNLRGEFQRGAGEQQTNTPSAGTQPPALSQLEARQFAISVLRAAARLEH